MYRSTLAIWQYALKHGTAETGMTDEGRVARVVDVQQVTVEVQMLVCTELDRRICRFCCRRAWREGQLCIDCKRREVYPRDALGGKVFFVNDNLLNVRVGGLLPLRLDWCHCVKVMV